MTIQDRIQQVERKIEEACLRAGRKRDEIGVVAVTKYVSLERTKEAYESGLRHLGENRWQDAEAKWRTLNEESPVEDSPIWHFIGSLQSRKAKDVVGKFHYIHSLDRLSLAEAIHKQAEKLNVIVSCFIQVNVSGEESKHGIEPAELQDFLGALKEYPTIKPIGLMTMAPYELEAEAARPVFRGLRELRDEMLATGAADESFSQLSMGMSGDFEVAIEEGATWIRLGSILVGKEEDEL
ncbi:YggS family pyridoxal phosphate-dependent enzyme [Paenibacillus sp. PAMC21692]|uniref:YggS family pyridoxal phosphate-dependent enzyme n=1 Tax=Paenibacillus sp. PAMC21692 TaxID=2762320 RepID=UPI00164D10BE|nr:YggS family pyridoxal phosphate-dependent enzyme [Paenibacillus sp. PAMC21692]QNK54514.1 YggS family pyridoxal phosphate-dependent enzyme [Paenibacillus sp. PAMC21692]